MIAMWIAGFFLVLSAFFLFGVPMIVLGPKAMYARMFDRPEGRIMMGTLATAVLAVILIPHVGGPLISAGDIAQMTVENFHRLNWSA